MVLCLWGFEVWDAYQCEQSEGVAAFHELD